jgi:hypothetical protein
VSWFAIKQISTGLFIPQFPKNTSKGGTHLEPTDKAPPRLFRTKQHAKYALDHWLKGKLHSQFSWDGEHSNLKREPIASRKAEDMAIVEVVLYERLCS